MHACFPCRTCVCAPLTCVRTVCAAGASWNGLSSNTGKSADRTPGRVLGAILEILDLQPAQFLPTFWFHVSPQMTHIDLRPCRYATLMEEGTNVVDAIIRSNPTYSTQTNSTTRDVIMGAERINITSVWGAMSKVRWTRVCLACPPLQCRRPLTLRVLCDMLQCAELVSRAKPPCSSQVRQRVHDHKRQRIGATASPRVSR